MKSPLEHIAFVSCQADAHEQLRRIALAAISTREDDRYCADWCGGCLDCLAAMIGYMHDWTRPEVRESWLNHFA